MKVRYFLIACFILLSGLLRAQVPDMYWIAFRDKAGTSFTIDKPEEFLSTRSIYRRIKQQIPIDETDLPVSPAYLSALKDRGAIVIHHSKWLNGATVQATPDQATAISNLSFVSKVQLTKPGTALKKAKNKFADEQIRESIDSAYYGASVWQVGQLNGQFLHNGGYIGQDMLIAVLDAGFYHTNELPAFSNLLQEGRLIGTRDFVSPGGNVFEEDKHGMNVLSTMAGEIHGQLIGTAPKASYLLLRSEETSSEYLVEEDNWVAAAEYADSVGADVINSSLGYTQFDDTQMNHTYADMDGKTTRVTRGANMAARKGILVVTSAGNEANDPWRYLVAPSDGDQVLAVGAVNSDGIWAPFSSLGPSSDGDVKPNVAALGWGTALQRPDGTIGLGSGTSFSSPVLAGMAACLWQANPTATAADIKLAIEQSASQYNHPDSLLGFGIPDFELADKILKKQFGTETVSWLAMPNPFQSYVRLLKFNGQPKNDVELTIYQANGSPVYRKIFGTGSPVFIPNLSNLADGLYVVSLRDGKQTVRLKLLKAGQ